MNALERIITGQIKASGPITLAQYMELCLLHPQHGYYSTQSPFGAAGDFITSPEISQIFGEICGLALAQVWMEQRRPVPITLAELGPGRGTLMADILRVIQRAEGMTEAAEVTLIEASAQLRQTQRRRLGDVRHLASVEALPPKPLLLIANEFFDALPIRQFERVAGGWSERMVNADETGLYLGLAPPVDLPRKGEIGDIVELCPQAARIVRVVANRIAQHGGAALIIDYGGWNGYGDTFQAVRRHEPVNPLSDPGTADLTAHVDFAALAAAARAAGAEVSAPVYQGAWLLALGAEQRAQRLEAGGDGGAMEALQRLTGPDEMGQLFKAMAIWPKHAQPVPGFEPLRNHADNA